MARPDLRHPANANGDWFVDRRCIDCGTCRDIAPDLFGVGGGQSVVRRQPAAGDRGATTGAWLAAQACPTSSIGTVSRQARPGRLYPREIEAGSGVFDCGYCSEDSFGASAWFVHRPGRAGRPGGNLLVDSPLHHRPGRAAGRPGRRRSHPAHPPGRRGRRRPLRRALRRPGVDPRGRPGGGAVRHRHPLRRRGRGDHPRRGGGARPGPHPGSVVYLLDDRFLFTGDSLAWSHERRDLVAFRDACWYSWSAQADSLDRLAAGPHRFAWVLPGHGGRVRGEPDGLHDRLAALVGRMRRAA
ncbi:MAG TPA: ferredoxin [Acidimicrobiia bacterium]|nr:ferredoxin [Acidimicrobiia bacterium]